MNLEVNKIFAAVLVAGITASFAGFVADVVIHPHEVEAGGEEADGGGASGPAAPQFPEPILAMIADADVAKGETLFRACAACHTIDPGGPNGIGPNLYNVINRGAAVASGFSYSGALKPVVGDEWDYIELNQFLWKPKSLASGTKMNFIGLKKPSDRAAVIAYLRTKETTEPALPSAAEIAAEEQKFAPPVEETEVSPEEEGLEGDGADSATDEAADQTVLEDAQEEAIAQPENPTADK